MRIGMALIFGVLLGANVSFAEPDVTSSATPTPDSLSTVPGVTLPQLVSPFVDISPPHHCKKLDGATTLSAIIGADGIPRYVSALQSDDSRLANFAIAFIAAQKFTPGASRGTPVAVAIKLSIALQTCVDRTKGASASNVDALVWRSYPQFAITAPRSSEVPFAASAATTIEKIGGRVSAPVPIFSPDPHFSKYARKEKVQGVCILGLTLDINGIPHDVHVVKSLETSLDQKAIEAVETWRFKPAMKNGTTPVPVMITVEVDFHLF